MSAMDWTVAVLMGGEGDERQVSLESGKCVAESLRKAGYKVISSDIDSKNLDILDNKDIDIFFLALHGAFGEDGSLQQILEDRGLVYTGSCPKASRISFDKIQSKSVFEQNGIKTAKYVSVKTNEDLNRLKDKLFTGGKKFVIKPSCQGSSVGIEIVDSFDEALIAAENCFVRFGDTLIEEFIGGREITVGILGNTALPIIEIKPKRNFYDYQAKYIDDATEFCFDTIGDVELENQIKQSALDCFNRLGCRHFARIDFILTQDGSAYVLEANTIPGMTSHSLLPKAAAKAGMDMPSLCGSILKIAMGVLV